MPQLGAFDLNLLRVLDVLLLEKQVSAAARQLHQSQPATSAALARLRSSFGDALLVRSGSGMVLTPFAETLQPRLRRLIEEVRLTLAENGVFDPADTVRAFRIAANDYAILTVVAPLIARVRQAAPNVRVEVVPLEDRFEAQLVEGEHDLAIRDAWALRSAPRAEVLFREDYVCIARVGHPRLSAEPTLGEYLAEDHGLISPHGMIDGTVDRALRRLGLDRRVAVTFPHFLAAPMIVEQTDLVMTVGRRVATRFCGEFRLRVFDPPFDLKGFSVSMAWPPRVEGDQGGVWLREQARAVIQGPV
jgi:DNA-binding transcriptional LysR family regulator